MARSFALRAAVAVTCVTTIKLLFQVRRKIKEKSDPTRQKRVREERKERPNVLKLLPKEGSMLINEFESTTTVTFYQGKLPLDFIQKRVREVVLANPWLAGKLVKGEGGEVVLSMPPLSSAPAAAGQRPAFQLLDPTDICLSTKTPYNELIYRLSNAIVRKGSECLQEGEEPLFLVSAVRDCEAPADRFALIVSLSHTIGDGHTFYSVYKMLSQSTEVARLRPERKHAAARAEVDKMGKEEHGFWFTYSMIAKMILAQMCKAITGYQCEVASFYIDEDWVKAQKNEFVNNKRSNNEKKVDAAANDVRFISTNDIITSWWFNFNKMGLAGMAMNMRGRIKDLDSKDVGNYENFLAYTPRDYKTPALIRQSVISFSRAGRPRTHLPSLWELLWDGRMSIISNWCSFYGDLELSGCKQLMHVPVYDFLGETAPGEAMCCVYRPRGDKLAVMLAGPPGLRAKLKEEKVLLERVEMPGL